MLIEKCRKCGNMPEVCYTVGYTFGAVKEAKAQVRCLPCGSSGRPVWGDPGADHKELLIEMAAGYWNEEQRQFKK